MAQKILGIDIGSHTIKGALFETSFRSYVLTDLFQSAPLKLDESKLEEHDVVIAESILQMMEKNNLTVQGVVTAIAGKLVSNRILKFPLAPKQIPKVLPFEMENYIPFALEELILDHHLIQTSKNETVCLAAAVQKVVLEQHLNLTRQAGIDPSFTTFDSVALYNLNQFIKNDPQETYAIIDLGHQKSSVCIVANQKIGLVRTLYTGGRDIDDAIRQELNLTLEQASEVKEKHGVIDLDAMPVKNADLKKLSACIKGVVHPLFQEIFQSFQLFKTYDFLPVEKKIQHVYFCGGTSLIKNLPEYFTSLINIPTERLYLLEDGGPDRASKQKEPVFATAVGIGLKISGRGKNASLIESINFRKDEYSFEKSLGDVQDQVFFYGRWVLIIFGLAILQLVFKNTSLRAENRRVEKVILQEYKKITSDKPPTSAKNAIKQLNSKITQLEQKQEVLTAGLTEMTALGILREISVLIPAQIPIDARELSIERNKITFRGETDSFASVDQIIASLQSKPEFTRVEKGDVRGTQEGKKSFQMTILVGEATEGKNERTSK